MKRAVTTVIIMLSLSAAAAAQSLASKAKPTRAKKAAAEAGAKAAASEDEVERLFDRYFLASGGLAYMAIRTRIMRGTVEMSASPVAAAFEAYEKMPKKSLVVISGPGGQFIQASDGGRKWIKSPFAGVMAAGAVADDHLSGGSGAFKWRNLFSSARLKGRAVVDGHETVVLAATPRGGRPLVMYFDQQTGLLRKQEFTLPSAAGKGDMPGAVHIDSYATVDGVKVPALFRYVYPEVTMTFRVTVVKHNVPIDDALFKDPNGK